MIIFLLFVSEFGVFFCIIPIILIISFILFARISGVIEQNRKTKEQQEEDQKATLEAENLAKENVEREAIFRQKRSKLSDSPEYNFIKQFAKKFENKGSESELLKLQMLLRIKDLDFSLDELKTLISDEFKIQRISNIRTKLLLNNPIDISELIDTYLNYYESNNNEALSVLADILLEKHLNYENLDKLRVEVENFKYWIELKTFEKRLAGESEQVSLENIDQLNGYEFEDFLKNLFSKMGYQVEQTKLSGDQGADLVVVKFGEKTVIQAKRYGAKVGNYAVQEIMAAISLYKAQKGMVVTNSYFTPAAVELANANNIELIDRDALEELINKHW